MYIKVLESVCVRALPLCWFAFTGESAHGEAKKRAEPSTDHSKNDSTKKKTTQHAQTEFQPKGWDKADNNVATQNSQTNDGEGRGSLGNRTSTYFRRLGGCVCVCDERRTRHTGVFFFFLHQVLVLPQQTWWATNYL
jgi:hypothetical protein